MAPVTRCIFCGRTDLSREHVWPVWTHAFIRKNDGLNFHYRNRMRVNLSGNQADRQYIQQTKRQGSVTNLRLKVVCVEHCNSGWMSRLESRVRPVLIPLLTGRPLVLNRQNQEVLATWIATRLLVAEFSDPINELVTPAIERSLLMGRRRPPDVMRIWIGRYTEGLLQNIYYRHATPMAVTPPGRPRNPLPKANNTQAQTFLIGELFVQGITTLSGVNFNAPAHWRLHQLWPYRQDFTWPPRIPVSHDLTSEIATALERTRTVHFTGRPSRV
jgi:hypothetical protein